MLPEFSQLGAKLMRRRKFIALLGGTAAAWSLPTKAQQAAMPTIGWLSLAGLNRNSTEAFRSGLADLGYAEDKNIRVLYRFADGNAARLPTLTSELVSLGATIIVTYGTTAIRAAHDTAPNVPIVSWLSGDPVAMGWAQTLAKPGGMITGVFQQSLNAKRIELLKEVRPQGTTFGYLMNAANPGNPVWRKEADDAARTLGVKLEIVEVKQQSEIADAINRMASHGVAGLLYIPDPVLGANSAMIAELTLRHKLPSVGDGPYFVEAGGLFAFSENYLALARRSAWYVDQIIKGVPPGDLAAEQGKEVKLVVNMKTAKEIGLTVPTSILARADELVE
jgi:putative ABC transport system substrate-binding protein